MQYSLIHYKATEFDTRQCNAIEYDTVQYNAMQYSLIHYKATEFDTRQCNAIEYDTVQYNAMQYSLIHYKATEYDTLQFYAMTEGGAEREHSLSKAKVKHDGAWSTNRWLTVTCWALCPSWDFFGVKF